MNLFRFLTNIAADERGQALAETVIVVPVLVLIVVGLIEVGRYGDYTIKVANAARAGVQYGAQNDVTAADIAGMQTAATNDAQSAPGLTATATNFCQCADGTAATCASNACPTSHRVVYVQVTATGTLPSLLNYSRLPANIRTITVSNTATMRVAQ